MMPPLTVDFSTLWQGAGNQLLTVITQAAPVAFTVGGIILGLGLARKLLGMFTK